MDAACDCYISELPNRESWGMNMRQLTVALALALASACIFIASCSSRPSPPVAVDALDGLLLSPAQINTAIGTIGILLNGTTSAVMSDNSANIPEKNSQFNLPVQASVYDGSGWIATR